MRVEDFQQANYLMNRRSALIQDLRSVEQTGLGITIVGKYQDDDFVDAIRPAVVNELKGRIELVEQDLKELGMEF